MPGSFFSDNRVMAATQSSLISDLTALSIAPGDTLMLHASLKALGPIVGGAATLISSLLRAIGPTGTLAAYVDFEPFYEEGEEEIPIFDKNLATAARDHGILHEMLRTWPGAMRSDHPDAGVAALGAKANWIVAGHPLQYGYGPGTPFDRLHALNAKILMLGAPLDTITMLHYAEHLAQIPDKRIWKYRRRMPQGWVDFEEFDTGDPVHTALPENCFEQIAEAFLQTGQGIDGKLALGRTCVFESQPLVAFGVQWIEQKVRFSLPNADLSIKVDNQ